MSAHAKAIGASDGSFFSADGTCMMVLSIGVGGPEPVPLREEHPMLLVGLGHPSQHGWKAHTWTITAVGIKASPLFSQQDTHSTSAAGRGMSLL